jgi:DNA-binding transcriptional LysR family regulator
LPTLTQLSYLVAVAQSGSFGKAAEACRVTQPTLSMQIRKLEAELGVLLLDRSRQPVERGCGVTLLPALAVEDWRRSDGSVLRPFSPPEPSRQVYLVQRRAYLKGRLIDAFVEELLTGLPPALRPAAGLGRGPSSALGRPL